MNAPVRSVDFTPHRFTIDDVWAMVRAGVIEEGAPVELIEGELVDMPADGPRHNDWSVWIARWLFTQLGPEYAILPASTLVLSDVNGPKPDFSIYPARLPNIAVRGPDVLLAIEQSDTTLRRDLGWKADLYARHGLREYWAIDLAKEEVHVHREPSEAGYRNVLPPFRADQGAESLLIPGLVLRLADLKPR
jgi:Uma2 family endonuclease